MTPRAQQRIDALKPLVLVHRSPVSETWLAVMETPGGRVTRYALKRLRLEAASDRQLVATLRREHAALEALRRVGRPGGAAWLGLQEGRPCLARRWVEGQTARSLIHECVARGQAADPGLVERLARGVLRELERAHGLNPPLIHRDVSPGNIVLGGPGGVTLLDWGLAGPPWEASGQGGEEPLAGGVRPGKVRYWSPRRLAGAPGDAADDRFALGVVCWEALSARRMFPPERSLEQPGTVPDPRELRGADPGLVELVAALLSG
jgi:serine/threonine-protein kinase